MLTVEELTELRAALNRERDKAVYELGASEGKLALVAQLTAYLSASQETLEEDDGHTSEVLLDESAGT